MRYEPGLWLHPPCDSAPRSTRNLSLPDGSRFGRGGGRILWHMEQRHLRILYSGHVQGVGFRYTVKSLVPGFDVTGTVRNLPDGRVELEVEGETEELKAFQQAVRDSGVGSLIRHEEASWSEARNQFRGFTIVG